MKKFIKTVSVLLCLVIVTSLCACSGTTTTSDNKEVQLTWYLRSSAPEGFTEVEQKFNEYLKEKEGFTVNIQFIEPADYASKCQLALASGDEVDLFWTGNWGGFLYEPSVAKGAFMDIEEIMKEEIPELWSYYREGIWEATRVSGKVYGVPMEQIFHSQPGRSFMKPIADKYNLTERIYNMAWVDEDTHGSMEEMEEVFDIIRAGEPEDYVISSTGSATGFEPYMSTVSGYRIENYQVYDDGGKRDMENAQRARRWNQKGYFPADAATIDNTEIYSTQGKEFTKYNRYLPGVEGKWRISHTYDAICIPTAEAVINRSGIQSTLTAISANSEHPVEGLKFIYRMLTDEYLLNLISYGIEGRDYTLIPDTNPQRMERESGAYYVSEYMVGSQFLAYLVPSYEDDVWIQTKYENENSRIDPLIGFSFDPSPVEAEMSSISAVDAEYSKIDNYGLEDPEVYVYERQKKRELAGLDVVIDEINRQLAEWEATQE